jgi:hypothetical protein
VVTAATAVSAFKFLNIASDRRLIYTGFDPIKGVIGTYRVPTKEEIPLPIREINYKCMTMFTVLNIIFQAEVCVGYALKDIEAQFHGRVPEKNHIQIFVSSGTGVILITQYVYPLCHFYPTPAIWKYLQLAEVLGEAPEIKIMTPMDFKNVCYYIMASNSSEGKLLRFKLSKITEMYNFYIPVPAEQDVVNRNIGLIFKFCMNEKI